jgi:hypothetical protein
MNKLKFVVSFFVCGNFGENMSILNSPIEDDPSQANFARPKILGCKSLRKHDNFPEVMLAGATGSVGVWDAGCRIKMVGDLPLFFGVSPQKLIKNR